MKESIVSGASMTDYIPQRAPMVMIDAFYGINGQASESGLTVTPDNIFCHDGSLCDGGIIEHIAQSGAMHIGYECRQAGRPVPLGFIGSVNKLTIGRLPRVGETLRTRIVMETKVFDITLVAATVCVGDEQIAQCKMKVATPENEQ